MKKLTKSIIALQRISKRNSFVTVVILIVLMFCVGRLFATNTVPTPKVTSSYDCAPYKSFATIRPITSGLWTNASTWPNGTKPTVNDDVIVPPGINLIMVGVCRANNITVQGKLSAVNWQAENTWIDLEARSIMVSNGGNMEIGTEDQPYFANKSPSGIRCQITLTGNKINNAPASYKAIMVMGGGRLELHGKKKMSWTNLSNTANVGATQITLKEAVDWEVGDKIALTATGLASGQTKSWNNVDVTEIIAISSNKRTLTLKSPLNYKHIGGTKSYTRARDRKTWDVNIQGEVGLLSHYIKIQGKMDGNNEQTGFGGHIMLMKNSIAHAEHIELYKMGQKAILGRYPFHWHLNEDKAQGSYLRNSSVHKSFNRAVTIHGTDYVTVDGVFAYDHIGHGIFLEDGGERFNTIKNNVVFVTRRPKSGEELTPSDNQFNAPQNRTPASYWITNPNNYFENNVAAGTEGTGFWFAFPKKPLFKSGDLPYFQGQDPTKQPLGRFEGFVAHTCMTGWDVFDQLNPDHSIKTNFGWDVNNRQLIKDGLFYGNDQALYCGLGVGGTNKNTVFYNCVFSDNKTGSMLAGDLTIENSLFNADTELGVFNGVREFFRFYDGPGRHIDCHFEGWNRSNTEMIKQITGGGATENFNPTFRGTTKGFSESFPFRFFPLPNTDATRSRKIGQFFKDYDGGLTGKAHTTIIRDIAFLRDGHEYRDPSWRNAARSDYYFAGLWFAGINSSGVRLSVVRSKPGTEDVCFYESGNSSSGTYKFPMIVNEGFLYTYYFDKAPANKSILLIWNRGDAGDLGYARFKGLGKLGNFRVNGVPRLNSIAAVENATNNAYFIAGNGDVYIKFRAADGDTRVNITLNWNHNGSFQPTTLPCTTNDLNGVTAADNDGDGRPDIVEIDTCSDPNNASDLNFGFHKTSENFQQFNTAAANTNNEVYWLIRADNSNDPYIVRSGLKFQGNQVPQLKIRAKSEAAGAFQVFWATTDQPDFAANRSVTVTPQSTNVFEELVFDMSNISTWMQKTITKIRLDFPPDTSAPRHTFIDYIHGPDASDEPCNQIPEFVFTRPTNTVIEEGDSLGVVVTVSSGNVANIKLYLNDILVRQENGAPYEWGTASTTQEDAALLNLAAGTYVLKAVATNNQGASVTKTKIIRVEKTEPVAPIVSFQKPNNSQFIEGDNLGVVVNVLDPDKTVTNVKLYINDVFVRQENVAPYEWGTANTSLEDNALLNLAAGTYVLKAVATNNQGAPVTKTKIITVNGTEPVAPIISFQKPNNSQFIEGDNLGVVVNASDPDGTITNVKLYINNVLVRQENVAPYEWGTANSGQNDTALLNLAIGTYILKAVATDNDGAKASTSFIITVTGRTSNQKPSISLIHPSQENQEFTLGQVITLTANAFDPDGNLDYVNFNINGALFKQNHTRPFSTIWTPTKVGTYTIRAIAFDEEGLSKEVSRTVIVKNNKDTTNHCGFGTPSNSALSPLTQVTYNNVHVLGTGGPKLSNFKKFTIDWAPQNNGLYQFAIHTNNGSPGWYVNFKNSMTFQLQKPQPEIMLSNTGFEKLDGSYWVTKDGDNLALVSKNENFTIYFSNSVKAPLCNHERSKNDWVQIKVFPNPILSSSFMVSGMPSKLKTLQIINLNGVVIKEIKSKNETELLEVSELPSGSYILQIKAVRFKKSLLFVKK
ncbi:Ig-like domain-containing protein [Aquimarina sp. 2201CG1-2-11]|uniref:Ig-like domain-containing protein n=1 Tax=Aquimarina discodermiae TaxID=3231043 RepID=UPI003461D664